MAKLDKQGLNTFIRELDKHINTKINRLDISPTAEKVMMANGSNVEEVVNINKTNIANNTTLATQALTKANEALQVGSNVKQSLVDKLTSEGLNVSTNNTFEELINGIALGKKWASGTTASVKKGYFVGANTYYASCLEVTDLTFEPSYIIALAARGTYQIFTVYNRSYSSEYVYVCVGVGESSDSAAYARCQNNVADIYVDSTGFCLPLAAPNNSSSVVVNATWIAIE